MDVRVLPENGWEWSRRGSDLAIVSSLRAVVAIPAYNEAERIGACLAAIDGQTGVQAGGLGIVLFLNNCSDGTDAVVAAMRHRISCPLRVIERDFPAAHAGWARREAMEAAADWLRSVGSVGGVILTTDADSRAPADWVARNLASIDRGADAVAGRIALDPDDAARLPDALHARGRLEGAYEALLIEIAARIDPIDWDPWPNHWTTSGATLAVRLSAYGQVGGMPAIPVGEDRAFVAALEACGAKVRRAPDILVVTSGRLDGRAPGGAADTMKLRCDEPESPCDRQIEPLSRAVTRSLWRRRIRRLHERGRLCRTEGWAPALRIPATRAAAIARLPALGQILAAVEAASPRLAFRPLRPRHLPAQIRRARAVLALMGAWRWARRGLAALRPGSGGAVATSPQIGESPRALMNPRAGEARLCLAKPRAAAETAVEIAANG